MKILTTFPGKFGDILWALPTIRALSRRVGEPIDLMVAAPFTSICPLIEAQPYINTCLALPTWDVQDTAPISPRLPDAALAVLGYNETGLYDLRLDLGYRGWPQRPLPFETLDCLNAQFHPSFTVDRFQDAELHLDEPWITTPRLALTAFRLPVSIGFTDEYFELKYGLYRLLSDKYDAPACDSLVVGSSPRWDATREEISMSWENSVRCIAAAQVFLGDCSALHVLACALGIPCILMEPQEARWQDIFYPYGKTGPQVTLVLGGDGRPTFDSRHVRDAVESVLSRRSGVRS